MVDEDGRDYIQGVFDDLYDILYDDPVTFLRAAEGHERLQWVPEDVFQEELDRFLKEHDFVGPDDDNNSNEYPYE